MKRELKINYGDLRQVHSRILVFQNALEDMEISASRFEGILEEQESEAVRALLNWRKEKLKGEVEELRGNLELLSRLLMDYIEDMTAAVRPNNENAYMLVDRNDIWFNLKQIMLEVERSEPPASGRALNAYSGRSTKVSKPHISESMTAGEISAARADYEKALEEKKNREENYRKLKNFCGGTASRARQQLENLYEELETIYKRNIVVYENTDDRYQSESGSVYHACSTTGQGIKDTIEMSRKFTDSIAGGVGTAIIDFIKAIFGLSCFVVKGTAASMVALITVPLGITPLWVQETGAEYLNAGAGIVSILKNPILLVEGIGQSMSDAVEKEGIAYGISYTLTDYVIGKKVESLLAGIKTVDKVDEVVDAVDDVADAIKAMEKVDDVTDAVKAVDKVDDVTDAVKAVEKVDDLVKNKILSYSEAEEIAFDAIHGPNNAEAVVLGKYGDGGPTAYTSVAKELDAQFFQLDNWDELVEIYSNDEIWKINEKFLDIQTSSGREIYLSHNPAEYINGNDFYSKELNYLNEQGYKFVKEGDIWHAIR